MLVNGSGVGEWWWIKAKKIRMASWGDSRAAARSDLEWVCLMVA